jgi:hypothetical protein
MSERKVNRNPSLNGNLTTLNGRRLVLCDSPLISLISYHHIINEAALLEKGSPVRAPDINGNLREHLSVAIPSNLDSKPSLLVFDLALIQFASRVLAIPSVRFSCSLIPERSQKTGMTERQDRGLSVSSRSIHMWLPPIRHILTHSS